MKSIKQNVGKRDGCVITANHINQDICGLLMLFLQFSGTAWHFEEVKLSRL